MARDESESLSDFHCLKIQGFRKHGLQSIFTHAVKITSPDGKLQIIYNGILGNRILSPVTKFYGSRSANAQNKHTQSD
jgi:hypothetical protein